MVTPVALNLPLSDSDVSGLKAGDIVTLSGRLVTGRDRIHKYLAERPRKEEVPFDLSGTVLYHCGPVVENADGGFRAVAAGPTTSMRVEMYEAIVIREYGLRGIMGKGGMGEGTRRALKEYGCVYLHTIGGAAVYLAARIRKAVQPSVLRAREDLRSRSASAPSPNMRAERTTGGLAPVSKVNPARNPRRQGHRRAR